MRSEVGEVVDERNSASSPQPSAEPPSRRPPKAKPHRDDQEFLPADLEIMETPPSPVRMAFIWIICAFVVVALGWSWFARIDIIAVAQGKIQPTGRVKVIQPLDTGKVASIRVENGKHVKAGDVLIEMERGDAQAEEADAAAALAAWRAEAARRRTAIAAATNQTWSAAPAIDWAANIPAANRSREEKVLGGDLAQLAADVGSLDAQIAQKEVERDHLAATITAQNNLIATLQQRVDMRAALVASGAGAKSALIDATETLQYQQTMLQTQTGQREQAIANLEVLAQEREKTITAFIADNSQKMAEALRQADDYQQRLIIAQLKAAHMSLTSPIDGVVMGSSVTTVGQVIQSGDEIMRIVPADATLEIECYLPNQDIGFVKPGQTAVVKVESFPFTRYGTLTARVTRVARDAIPEPDAQAAEGDPAKAGRDARLFGPAQPMQNLVFPVTLTPGRSAMNVDGETLPLTPGMTVSVEIATGSRRILEYLFSPLVEVASEAMKER
jgi:hemolysin D